MKKFEVIVLLIVIYFVIYFLQVNFFSWFNIAGVQPNLFVLLVLFIGIFTNKKMGAVCGFIIGLYTDFLFSNSIGISAVLLTFIGHCGEKLVKRFSRNSRLTIILMGTISVAVYELLCVAYKSLFFSASINFLSYIYILAIELLFNVLLIIIFYPLIHKFGLFVENVYSNNKMLTRYF